MQQTIKRKVFEDFINQISKAFSNSFIIFVVLVKCLHFINSTFVNVVACLDWARLRPTTCPPTLRRPTPGQHPPRRPPYRHRHRLVLPHPRGCPPPPRRRNQNHPTLGCRNKKCTVGCVNTGRRPMMAMVIKLGKLP